jgi:hypothetical protein
MIIPVWAYAAGGAGVFLAGVLGGWTVRDWKADSDALEAKEDAFEQYEALTNELAKQSLTYEYLVQGIRDSERTDRETIREIYRDKIVPAECAAPAGAVSLLTEAVGAANAAAAGEPDGKVSRAP